MSDRQPTDIANLDSNDYGLEPLRWSRVEARLAADLPRPETPVFLGTVRPDGTPHAAGIGALWLDGELYFTTSPLAAKARHLAANPACTMSMRLEGLDLVLEGRATRVTERGTLEPVRDGFNAGGWPATLDADGDALTAPYSAPSAGPPPWHVYRLTFHTVFGVASTEPQGATRWTFAG
jgi:hypothetical protein